MHDAPKLNNANLSYVINVLYISYNCELWSQSSIIIETKKASIIEASGLSTGVGHVVLLLRFPVGRENKVNVLAEAGLGERRD